MATPWIFRLAAVMTLVCIAAGCSGARRTTVTSVPAGAAVVVNDQPVGVTPVQVVFPRGDLANKIRIVSQGYRSWEASLTILQARQQFCQPIALEKLLEPKIIFTSVPPGAEVLVDGERLGETPFTLPSMKPGTTCEVLFRREGYMKEQKSLTVDGLSAEITVSATLKSSVELYYRRKIKEESQNHGYLADLMHHYMLEKRFDDAVTLMREGLATSAKDSGIFWQEIDRIWAHQYNYGTPKEIEETRRKIISMLEKVLAEDKTASALTRQKYLVYCGKAEPK